MKSLFTIFLLASFIGVAVFGFARMAGAEHEHSGCLAATSRGVDCPDESNTVASSAFHVTAFKSFSNGLVALIATVLVVLGLGMLLAAEQIPFFISAVRLLASTTASPPLIQPALSHWLALHENSPAIP